MSYTRFVYRDLRAAPEEVRPGDTIVVEVEVANEGEVAGEETVFLFLRDPVASIARPLLELKGVAKIALEPGARGTVRLTLSTDDLTFLGPDLEPRLEPGLFEIHVGPSAATESLLRTTVRVVGADRSASDAPRPSPA